MTTGAKKAALTHPESLKRIRQMVEEGKPQTYIAKQFGVAQSYVSRICRQEGIATKRLTKGDMK